ncbi:Acg family FMN-binding oxidoreductase [Catellatospora chokoriensis]|uniref:NAD(P)H nitroreductase n=1 Tax=Catellatospora chokoriensis TaxID=310353 RepID=A0A8J3NVW3_9ACTN|nr:nitroreductase [Catellatospora chokoriensis]GIF94377.1 NAD(P)H nitroreductase [Catellatospora chokoriensis]
MTTPTREHRRPTAAAYAQAAEAAGHAPSIHNTQPWHWQIHPDRLDLYADTTRALPGTDPDERMLLVSCGAALHHAQVALHAEGYDVAVRPLPDPGLPEHLATVTITGGTPVTAHAVRLVQAMQLRHTDRRPTVDVPVTAEQVDELRRIADAVGVHLHRLTPDQVTDLAVAVSHAEDAAAAEPAVLAETHRWTGPGRPAGTGLPPEVIPDRRPETDVGERDFGARGTLSVGGGHDKASTYVVLFGTEDDRAAWLRAGQALSAVWLHATMQGLAVLPFSQVVEVDGTRVMMRRILSNLGYPYLVLRLGVADPEHALPGHTPRLPFDATATIDQTGR